MIHHTASSARRAIRIGIWLAVMLIVFPLSAAGEMIVTSGTVLKGKPIPSMLDKGYKLQIGGRDPFLGALEVKLKDQIKDYSGTFSVYVKDLKSGEYFTINNRQMYAASLVKLYAMGAAFAQIRDGKLKEADVEDEMRKMIVSSDNWCFNDLTGKIGLNYLNKWIEGQGYANTAVRHGCNPSDNSFGQRTATSFNRTSVRDCGLFLERVYRKQCVDAVSSGKMLTLLKNQSRRSKIPAGVPAGVTVANKTGETDDTSHDAAIVFSPGGDYILVVMVTAPGSGWSKGSQIAGISKTVYRYFNKN